MSHYYELNDSERLTDLLAQAYRLYQLKIVRKKVDRLEGRARAALKRNPDDNEARSFLGWCECRRAGRERSPDVTLNAVIAIFTQYWQVERARGPIKLDDVYRDYGNVDKIDEGLLFIQEALLIIGVLKGSTTLGAILQRLKVVTVTHPHVNPDRKSRRLKYRK